jgi:hypothetical protein
MKRPSIYMIESKSRQDLAGMFMRFQEYYESPEFKGKVFTIEEFAHWYAQQYGSFSYSKDWYGFNIPSQVIQPFRNGQFNPLTAKEQQLLDICKNASGDFYVIGVTPSADYFAETVKHEFVHGAFHVNKPYRLEVAACINDHRTSKITRGLSKMGYHTDVAIDETNAYILVEPETIADVASIRDTEKLRYRLDVIFKKHFGFSMQTASVPTLTSQVEHILV